jgi:tagatose-1,6-bisphosphate aldolase
MNDADLYREQGYLHARAIFEARQVDELRGAIDRILEGVAGTEHDANHVWKAVAQESVLEPVVRVPEEQREDAIVEAARELGATRPSLYKCQVPFCGRGEADEITRRAGEIDAVLPVPWVVLSQGVEPADFPRAVEASCKGGASGMLAGRAVWTATLDADDPTELLREISVPKLQELAAIVDAHGRPWREKGTS